MRNAFALYQLNRKTVDNYHKIYVMMKVYMPLLVEERDDLLRAQLVMAVSSFDTFIHDIVRIGMLQIYQGTRVENNKFNSYEVPLKNLKLLESASNMNDKLICLDNTIRSENSKDSYQSPKNIENVLGIIGVTKIWTHLGTKCGITAEDVKRKLALIVQRRNQIAHESDINPATSLKYPIFEQDVKDSISFIDNIVSGLMSIV